MQEIFVKPALISISRPAQMRTLDARHFIHMLLKLIKGNRYRTGLYSQPILLELF
jgi:hypothetical protein